MQAAAASHARFVLLCQDAPFSLLVEDPEAPPAEAENPAPPDAEAEPEEEEAKSEVGEDVMSEVSPPSPAPSTPPLPETPKRRRVNLGPPGPTPEMPTWRGQRWRANTQRWANRGGVNREWYRAYYRGKAAAKGSGGCDKGKKGDELGKDKAGGKGKRGELGKGKGKGKGKKGDEL